MATGAPSASNTFKDRILVEAPSPGASDILLTSVSPVTGYNSLSSLLPGWVTGQTFEYFLEATSGEWEIGIGLLSADNLTFVRNFTARSSGFNGTFSSAVKLGVGINSSSMQRIKYLTETVNLRTKTYNLIGSIAPYTEISAKEVLPAPQIEEPV